jgi:Trk K+ transport system NAD-binding subunit
LIELPIYHGSSIESKEVKQIKWPKNCLLVCIKRGEKEIIPRGDTLICAGDYIVLMCDEFNESIIRSKLSKIFAG